MEEMTKETEKKQEKNELLLWVKLQTCLTGGVLALLLIAGIFAEVQISNVMKVFRGVDVDKINSIVLSLQNTASELENVDMETINKTVDALKSAAQNLGNADIGAVNDGIQALTAAAENLQGLDIQQMNELIESLEAVAKQMEKTTAAFGKLFGR